MEQETTTSNQTSTTNTNTNDMDSAPTTKRLFGYQRIGVERLIEQKRLLLADEMGLGKTVQCIEAINQLAREKKKAAAAAVAASDGQQQQHDERMRILIICPKSVLGVWQSELETWLEHSDDKNDDEPRPQWNTHIAQTGKKKTKKQQQQQAQVQIGDPGTITLINYDICHKLEQELRQPGKFDVIICDEAHYLKSPDTLRTMSILGSHIARGMKKATRRNKGQLKNAKTNTTALQSDYLWLLTGTPVLNRPMELFPLLSALDPRNFSNFFDYAERYCDPKLKTVVVRRGGGPAQRFQMEDYSGASNLHELSQRLERVMLRRFKSEVLHELPAKFRSCTSLTTDVDIGKQEFELLKASFEESIKDSANSTNTTGLGGLGNFGSNAQELVSYMNQMPETDNALVGMISKIRRETAWLKLKPAIELLEEYTQQEKVVVFAHHIDLIDDLMGHFGSNRAVVVKGGMNNDKRNEAVRKFQTDDNIRVFLGSIRAAGVGVTLTAASLVVFLELDWSPSVMSQAEDRCHRVGQKENVRVQYLVFKDTIDEWLSKTLIFKNANIRQILPEAASDNAGYVLDFGKHAGMRLLDVPRPYIDYLIKQRIYENRNRHELWVALHDIGLVSEKPPHLSLHSDTLVDLEKESVGPPAIMEDRPSPMSEKALKRDGLQDNKRSTAESDTEARGQAWSGYYPEEDYYDTIDVSALADEYYKEVDKEVNQMLHLDAQQLANIYDKRQRSSSSHAIPDSSIHKPNAQNSDAVNYTFDFGKHRGRQWGDVPMEYRNWILKEEVWKGRARASLRKALLQARVVTMVANDSQDS